MESWSQWPIARATAKPWPEPSCSTTTRANDTTPSTSRQGRAHLATAQPLVASAQRHSQRVDLLQQPWPPDGLSLRHRRRPADRIGCDRGCLQDLRSSNVCVPPVERFRQLLGWRCGQIAETLYTHRSAPRRAMSTGKACKLGQAQRFQQPSFKRPSPHVIANRAHGSLEESRRTADRSPMITIALAHRQ